jgi:hypothetical protein
MPIIQVASVEAAPVAIVGFYKQLVASEMSRIQAEPTRSLLPYCSHAQRITEHAANVLSDITTGFKDLVGKVATPEGKQELEEYLGQDTSGIIRFWQEDCTLE